MNGDTKWADAIAKDVAEVDKFEVVKLILKEASSPPGYKRISNSFVCHKKLDLRRKTSIVFCGHRTDPPNDFCYSGVVPL